MLILRCFHLLSVHRFFGWMHVLNMSPFSLFGHDIYIAPAMEDMVNWIHASFSPPTKLSRIYICTSTKNCNTISWNTKGLFLGFVFALLLMRYTYLTGAAAAVRVCVCEADYVLWRRIGLGWCLINCLLRMSHLPSGGGHALRRMGLGSSIPFMLLSLYPLNQLTSCSPYATISLFFIISVHTMCLIWITRKGYLHLAWF